MLLFEGAVSRRDMVRLLVNISLEKRLTGLLTLKQGVNQKEIFFRNGRPRFIYSNLRSELLGEFLIKQGLAARAAVDVAAGRSNGNAGRLGDALVSTGAVAPHQLAETLQTQFRQRFLDLFEWEAGWFGFFENATLPKRAVLLDLDPVGAVIDAVRNIYPVDLIKAWQAEHMDRRLVRVEGAKVGLQELRLLPKEARIVNLLDSYPSLNSMLAAMPQTPESGALVHRVVFLLVEIGILQFRGIGRGNRR